MRRSQIEVPESVANLPRPAWEVAFQFPAQGCWTEEDYFSYIHKRGFELADGQVEILPVPSERHQLIVASLYRALFQFAEPRQLGLVLFSGIRVRTAPNRMREPDLAFLSAANSGRRSNQCWDGADLVVEVVSSDDPDRDWVTKRQEYARTGIQEYWIVDPGRRVVAVLSLQGTEYVVRGEYGPGQTASSPLLSGFAIRVEDVLDPPGSR